VVVKDSDDTHFFLSITPIYLESFFWYEVNIPNRDSSIGPGDWATIVHRNFEQSGGNMSHLTALPSHSHLIVPSKCPISVEAP
jgi:hypothetical protein